MSSSVPWRFPAASSMVFSREMFLAGPAPAGRITLVLWDRLGQRGTCQLVKQQVAGFLQEEHCSGATCRQLLLGALAGQWLWTCPGRGDRWNCGAACHQACPGRGVRGDGTTL